MLPFRAFDCLGRLFLVCHFSGQEQCSPHPLRSSKRPHAQSSPRLLHFLNLSGWNFPPIAEREARIGKGERNHSGNHLANMPLFYLLLRLRRAAHKLTKELPSSVRVDGSGTGVRNPLISPPEKLVVWMFR